MLSFGQSNPPHYAHWDLEVICYAFFNSLRCPMLTSPFLLCLAAPFFLPISPIRRYSLSRLGMSI